MTPKARFQSIVRTLSLGRRTPIILGLVLTATMAWIASAPSPLLLQLITRIDYLVYDLRLWALPKQERNPEHNIVIVDLDERSLQAEGQFPWNRIKVGRLVEKLRDGGAAVVGFDITFPEPDRSIRDLLAPVDTSTLDQGFLATLSRIEPQIDSDQYFADVMASSRSVPGSEREVKLIDVILAINFDPSLRVTYNTLPPPIVAVDPDVLDRLSLYDMSGYTGNIPLLQGAASGAGNMGQVPDLDGVVRRVPLVVRYGDSLYPTLALEMVRVYNFLRGYELLTATYAGTESVRAVSLGGASGRFVVPTDSRGSVLVPYFGTSSRLNDAYFRYISATDVLNDNVAPDLLVNSLVLIGTSAPGLQDLRSTPLASVYPGVEVHATLLHSLLDSEPYAEVTSGAEASTDALSSLMQNQDNVKLPYRPDWELTAQILPIAILGLSLSFLFPYLGAVAMGLSSTALITALIGYNAYAWVELRLDLPLILPLTLVLLLTALNMSYGYLAESKKRRLIKGMFDQYAPPVHIEAMLKNPDQYNLDGESKEMTVLFSDIRHFTALSESLDASQLKALLNEFFTPVTQLIFEHGGTIDKYVGDMVMAFWGAPMDDDQHREHGVRAALALLEEVKDLQGVFQQRGVAGIEVGIGVNSGLMNVGDMGSDQRKAYTVLGDAVNLGSRLEGLTKLYGVKCLIGEESTRGLDNMLFRQIDRVRVRGKQQVVACFEPLGLKADAGSDLTARVAAFHAALAHYHGQQWDNAERVLRELSQQEPEIRLYQLYLQRIAKLRRQTLPEQWDGVYVKAPK